LHEGRSNISQNVASASRCFPTCDGISAGISEGKDSSPEASQAGPPHREGLDRFLHQAVREAGR